MAGKNAEYRAQHREELVAYNVAYRDSHRSRISSYNTAYSANDDNRARASARKIRSGARENGEAGWEQDRPLPVMTARMLRIAHERRSQSNSDATLAG